MFDTHARLLDFYHEHVLLKEPQRKELRDRRQSCLLLLREGLRKLGERPHAWYKKIRIIRFCNQGSYAMHTLNQHPRGEYDIDVGVIFEGEGFLSSPLRARNYVARALRSVPRNFHFKPIARTNAVTVWYKKGFHVDLAIYRETTDAEGTPILEHAGPHWDPRDPRAVNRWFARQVKDQSPRGNQGATVDKEQLRRVVRLVKAFARSRVHWSLPGGLVLTILVCEVYRPDPHRDDVALYETLQALRSPACLLEQALMAWYWVFRHESWRKQAEQARLDALAEPEQLKIRIDLAAHEHGPITSRYRATDAILPRGTWLRLSLRKRLGIEHPLVVRWVVRSPGSEAGSTEALSPEHVSEDLEYWRQAVSSGRYSITCEVIKLEKVVARGARHFVVAHTP
jgi:hypothetical protein